MVKKREFFRIGKKALKATPRLEFLNNILLQKPKIVSLDCTKFDRNTQFLYRKQRHKSILDFILCKGWKEKVIEGTSTMESSKEKY